MAGAAFLLMLGPASPAVADPAPVPAPPGVSALEVQHRPAWQVFDTRGVHPPCVQADEFVYGAEPGGCAALAALLSGRYRPEPGETVAGVISGAKTNAV